MSSKKIIEITDLCKSFKNKKVLDNVNFTVNEGDIFGFLGPNGAGKTTTIRAMLKLIHPSSGIIKINGYDLKNNFENAIKYVGAIVEAPKFHPYLSGYKNLELMANLIDSVSTDKVDEVLSLVGLAPRALDKVSSYSLGMKQRLGIANALLNNPKLVILDEPTNGLDPQGMKEIRDLVVKLASTKNITFFISTHLLHEVEQICNRVAVLNSGKVVFQGEVSNLLNIDYDIIEIFTSSSDKAINIIKDISYVKEVTKSINGIIVKTDKNHSYELNKFLIGNDIDVKYLIPHNQSLESFFIELINGGNKND